MFDGVLFLCVISAINLFSVFDIVSLNKDDIDFDVIELTLKVLELCCNPFSCHLGTPFLCSYAISLLI